MSVQTWTEFKERNGGLHRNKVSRVLKSMGVKGFEKWHDSQPGLSLSYTPKSARPLFRTDLLEQWLKKSEISRASFLRAYSPIRRNTKPGAVRKSVGGRRGSEADLFGQIEQVVSMHLSIPLKMKAIREILT